MQIKNIFVISLLFIAQFRGSSSPSYNHWAFQNQTNNGYAFHQHPQQHSHQYPQQYPPSYGYYQSNNFYYQSNLAYQQVGYHHQPNFHQPQFNPQQIIRSGFTPQGIDETSLRSGVAMDPQRNHRFHPYMPDLIPPTHRGFAHADSVLEQNHQNPQGKKHKHQNPNNGDAESDDRSKRLKKETSKDVAEFLKEMKEKIIELEGSLNQSSSSSSDHHQNESSSINQEINQSKQNENEFLEENTEENTEKLEQLLLWFPSFVIFAINL